jgi:integrase
MLTGIEVSTLVTLTVKTSKVDPILKTEWAMLVGHFDGDYQAFFRLLLETGMRTSEGLSLRAADIGTHHDGRTTVKIERLKKRKPSKENEPIIIVSEGLAIDLKALGRKHRARLFKFSRVAAWKALKRICGQAGIRQLTPHQFRHTFAREFAKTPQYDISGRALSALEHKSRLAELLGHSSTRWVETYFQPHATEITELTGEMSKIFSKWG